MEKDTKLCELSAAMVGFQNESLLLAHLALPAPPTPMISTKAGAGRAEAGVLKAPLCPTSPRGQVLASAVVQALASQTRCWP